MLVRIGSAEQILIANEASLAGHDPATGAELWRHPFPGSSRGNATGSQPIAWQDGRVFISKGYGHGAKMLQLAETNGGWQVVELWHRPAHLRTKFSNPVPGPGRIYGLDERRLQAIAPADGSVLWNGGRYGHGQILRRGEQILVLGERGGAGRCHKRTGTGPFPGRRGQVLEHALPGRGSAAGAQFQRGGVLASAGGCRRSLSRACR